MIGTCYLLSVSVKTIDFKNSLKQAKELAEALPGGDCLIEDQDQIISMLQMLKERKRYGGSSSLHTALG